MSQSWNKKSCCVPFCRKNIEENKDLNLYCFPRNVEKGCQWLANIDNALFRYMAYEQIRSCYRICEYHFTDICFRTKTIKKKLTSNAYPTIFPSRDVQSTVSNEPTGTLEGSASTSASTSVEKGPAAESQDASTLPSIFSSSTVKDTRAQRRSRQQVVVKNFLWSEARGKSRNAATVTSQMLKRILFKLSSSKIYRNDISKFLDNISPAAVTFLYTQLRRGIKSFNSHRWTDDEKAVSLSIYKTSRRCYQFLGKLFCLPSPKTLRRHLQSISLNAGMINDSILQHLSVVSEKMRPRQKYCVLMFDEVHLRPHIDISRQCRSVCGLENFGNGSTKFIADRALVFMIRGINEDWKQPICYYFVKSKTKSSLLKGIIKDIIQTIHKNSKFRILATVCDQSSTNQTAMLQLSRESGHGDDFIFEISDIVKGESVKYTVFHIFDPPHLLKCMRNHFMQKDIYFEDKFATWQDLETIYSLDTENPGPRACKKLTDKHLKPDGRYKTRVCLASQVFSGSVLAGLNLVKSVNVWKCHSGTTKFIEFMDRLFDSFNGVRKSTKPMRMPLTDRSKHNAFWDEAKPFLASLVFKQNGQIVKSPSSVKYYIATICNIQSLWVRMKELGFKYLLTRCLNQDPLENFFGIIRGLSGQNYRPTCLQFEVAFKTCLVNDVSAFPSLSNCELDSTYFLKSLSFFSPPSTSAQFSSHQTTNISKLLSTMRSNTTSAYVAGFIFWKCIRHDCQTCNQYFVTDTCTDNHTLIHLKESERLIYPSLQFIAVVDTFQLLILKEFVKNINKNNLLVYLKNQLPNLVSVCLLHDSIHNDIVKRALIIITIKHCCKLINRKLTLRGSRGNDILDNFLRQYGTIRENF